MTVLSSYIQSITRPGRVLIEKILDDGQSRSLEEVSLSQNPDLISEELRPLSKVTASSINDLLQNTAIRNEELWNGVDYIDNKTRRIEEIANSSNSSSMRAIRKVKAVLDGLMEAASRGESISSVYTELFSDSSRTDAALSTSVISGGYLSLPIRKQNSVSGEWSILSQWPTGTIVKNINKTTGGFTAVFVGENQGNMGSIPTEYSVIAKYSLTNPSVINSIILNTGDLDVDSVIVSFEESEEQKECLYERVRISGVEQYIIWINESIPVEYLTVTYSKKHFSPSTDKKTNKYFSLLNSFKRFLINDYNKEVIEKVIMKIASIDYIYKYSDIKRPTLESIKKSLHGYKYEYKMNVKSARVANTEREIDGRWVSLPFKVSGNIKTIFLNVDGEQPVATNSYWDISIEGSSWIRIVPSNKREITGERLYFDPTGIAKLKYPMEKSVEMSLTGLEGGTSISLIEDSRTGHVIELEVDRPQSENVTISYTTPYSGIVNTDEIGISTSRAKVVDAMTGGQLGERFESSSHKRVTLANTPSGDPAVYVNGVIAIKIATRDSLYDPDLDEDKVYYKIVGRTVLFKKDYENIAIYYKYLQSSVRIRTSMTTTEANRGNSPMIDSVFVGIRTENI